MYGNSVVRRDTAVDVTYAFTSWINTITTLSPGILTNVYLFVHRRNISPSLRRLQIWRPVRTDRYTLVWEKIVTFNSAFEHALYKVRLFELIALRW